MPSDYCCYTKRKERKEWREGINITECFSMYKVLPGTLSDYFVHCNSDKSEVQRSNKLHVCGQQINRGTEILTQTSVTPQYSNLRKPIFYIYTKHESIFWSPASIFNQLESTLALWSGCQRLMNCIEGWRKAKAKHTEPIEKCTCPTQTSGYAKTGALVVLGKTAETKLLEGRSWKKRRKGLTQTRQRSREIPHDEEWLVEF